MQTHVRVLAWLLILEGAFLVALAVSAPLVTGLIGSWSAGSDDPDGLAVASVMKLAGAIGAYLFALLAIPFFAAGLGLFGLQPWARVLSIVVTAVSLAVWPVGTAIGIYGLWVMFNKQTEALFSTTPQAPA